MARSLDVQVDRLPGLAEVGVGVAQIAEGVAFAAPISDLAGDGQVLFEAFDRPVSFTESGVGDPQVAEVRAFERSISQSFRSGETGLHPSDLLERGQAQLQEMSAGMGKSAGGSGGVRGDFGSFHGPGLAGEDVAPLPIEESKPAEDVLMASQVEIGRLGKQREEVVRMPRPCRLLL